MRSQSRLSTFALLSLLLCVPTTYSLGSEPEDDLGYRAGIGLLNKGLNDLAATEFRKYLEEHPSGAEATNARYSLAVSLVRLGKHAEALNYLDTVIDADEFAFLPDALLLKAQCHIAAEEYPAAAAALEVIVHRHPGFAQADRAAAMHGESLYRLGKFEEAAEELAGVIAKWPESGVRDRAELFAAMAEIAGGNVKAGASRASALRQRSPKGEYSTNAALIEAQCRQRMRELPAAAMLFETASGASGAVRIQALLGLAAVSRAQGDVVRAERALADAAASEGAADMRDLIAIEKGKVLFQQGSFKAAQASFSEARKAPADSAKAEASFWFAKCQIRQGKAAEGIANLEHAAERFETSELVPDMLFERAAAMSNAGDEGALEAWKQWRARFGNSELLPEAWIAEAWCAHRSGKFEECQAALEKYKADYADRERSEPYQLLVAENAFALGEFEAGLDRYAAFVQQFPKSSYAWRASVRRALCLVKLGRGREAGEVLEAATALSVEQDPSLRRAALAALADHSIGAGDWVGGERWSQKLAAEKGTSAETQDALLRQGICIERQRRFADALPVFERVIAEGPGTEQAVHAQFERGQSLLELGRLDEARTALEEVSEAREGATALKPHVLRHLAAIATKQGRHEDAATLLTTLQGSSGGEAPAGTTLELGTALLAAGKYVEAERELTKCLRAEEASAGAGKAGVLRAIAINRQGRHDEAVQELRTRVEGEGVDAETAASGRYEMALGLRSLGRDSEAAESLVSVIGKASPRLECYAALELAQIQSKAEKYAEAMKLLDVCHETVGKVGKGEADLISQRATYLRAACLLRLERPKEAAEVLKAFATTYPESQLLGSARLVRGEALLTSGQAREAALELSLVTSGDGTSEVQQAALLRLGEAWASCQEWGKSERAFTDFLDRHHQSELWFQARFGQGWARENQGRYDAAIEAYREVVGRHTGPTAARAQFQIGECLYGQKKHEQAVAELLKTDVLFEYPEWSSAALYEAGRCLAEMNRTADALKQFDELIRRFPDTRWAKLAAEKRQAGAAAALPGRKAEEGTPVR